jgi:NAD(P)-dependent dehydrogenase (short-subunit alcohol dehydrogenase family)
MNRRLKDKIAIVTGAGSSGPGWGNGKATAVVYAREGAKIFAVDIDLSAVCETKDIIDKEGGDCTIFQADVSKSNEVKSIIEHCIKKYGRIDILHNNVGINEPGGPEEITEESWDHVHAVNLKSIFLTCKYTLPHMVRQERGVIINISSLAAIRWLGIPYISYFSSKAAIIQFTKGIALQYAKNNIRANSILPGYMNTPIIIKPLKDYYGGDIEKMMESRNKQCPTGKMGDAWDIAYASLFLASDEAKYITGTELIVDGGLSCKCS